MYTESFIFCTGFKKQSAEIISGLISTKKETLEFFNNI